MQIEKNKCIDTKNIISILIGAFSLIICGLINPVNHYVSGFVLVMAAVGVYFYQVFQVTDKNWLDVRAVFSGVWLATIGLASFRLTDYQEEWMFKTWVLLAVAYMMFQFGATIGISNGANLYDKICNKLSKFKCERIKLQLKEERLFAVCVGVTLIGLTCFLINVAIKGYVPAFEDLPYTAFYTKFHVFAVAATAIGGLCYYCIKTQNLSKAKKTILWVCILYVNFIFPVLVVSRGVFIVAALPLSVTVFYLNNKKLSAFIVCLVIMAGVYLLTSNLRGYSDAYLEMVFEPSDIVVSGDEYIESIESSEFIEGTEFEEVIGTEDESDIGDEGNEGDDGDIVTFSLPPKAVFLYSYLTVSHDNFNEVVQNLEGYTWGAKQFQPFNVILRIEAIQEFLGTMQFHAVKPDLNTVNMIGLFYYDFHEIGVLVCTFLWAALFGIIQGIYLDKGGIFTLMIHGFTMNAVALSFFSAWVDSFELWMLCGTVVIIACISSVHIAKKGK